MKDLARIEAAYDALDLHLEQAKTASTTGEIGRIVARQVLNDQGYFLPCRGQLEVEILEACRTAIRRQSTSSDWQVRRSWYLYNPNDKRLSGLSFEDRAVLVLDRDAGRASPWAKTMFHHATRNDIAHGGLRSTRVDLNAFIQDCSVIQAALYRGL